MLGATSFLLSLLVWPFLANAASRTSPPSGSIIVRAGTTTSGEFSTIQAAVNSLPSDGSKRSVFIYPGTYNEQVYISRSGPLAIYGYTTDDTSYTANTVNIVHSSSQASGGASNDATGTLRVHKDDFSLYNVNVRNSYGQGSQAVALSAYGNRMGLYGSKFLGYQDTLLANQGTQVYGKCYIEGAVDFIFGRQGQAYFESNTISSIGTGYITANGRESDDNGIYILNKSTLVLGSGAASGTSGKVYLGRPWGNYARVVFKNTNIGSHINKALWSIWNSGDERTDHVLFGTYANTGSGASGVSIPSFAKALSSSEANSYTIATAVGSDWGNWVDKNYVTGS